MIMHPVNSGVGVPGMGGMEGVPGITGTDHSSLPRAWSAEVTPNCFIVHDADGQQLAYVYYESEPGRRSAAKLLTRHKAGRAIRRASSRVSHGIKHENRHL